MMLVFLRQNAPTAPHTVPGCKRLDDGTSRHQEPYTQAPVLYTHVNSADIDAHVHALAGILTERSRSCQYETGR